MARIFLVGQVFNLSSSQVENLRHEQGASSQSETKNLMREPWPLTAGIDTHATNEPVKGGKKGPVESKRPIRQTKVRGQNSVVPLFGIPHLRSSASICGSNDKSPQPPIAPKPRQPSTHNPLSFNLHRARSCQIAYGGGPFFPSSKFGVPRSFFQPIPPYYRGWPISHDKT